MASFKGTAITKINNETFYWSTPYYRIFDVIARRYSGVSDDQIPGSRKKKPVNGFIVGLLVLLVLSIIAAAALLGTFLTGNLITNIAGRILCFISFYDGIVCLLPYILCYAQELLVKCPPTIYKIWLNKLLLHKYKIIFIFFMSLFSLKSPL